ncbi:vitamin K epoxide reductase family protein [Streptomyces barkulensis]|uniref:vitamin K epoxide reductase family protein n=2 Tax=Streptomyces barkulensis TaxID=1257026 RepID=UPI001F4EB4D1|nr:vitamin K epoxide reductase family protein [Streptomyces barkulensis]
MTAERAPEESGSAARARRSPLGAGRATALVITLTGLVGWLASFQLTADGWRVLGDPDYRPSCDLSPVVGCGSVLSSPQGSVLGFPNMLLGLGAFAAVAALGAALLLGARLHRALWLALNAGALAGVVLVHWLIQQSLYELGRICPYCAVVWAVTVPLFWYVTLHDLRHGVLPVPRRARGVLSAVLELHGVILATWYAVVVLLVLTRFWDHWTGLL